MHSHFLRIFVIFVKSEVLKMNIIIRSDVKENSPILKRDSIHVISSFQFNPDIFGSKMILYLESR